jgi:hypothetical protein
MCENKFANEKKERVNYGTRNPQLFHTTYDLPYTKSTCIQYVTSYTKSPLNPYHV